MPAVAPGEVRAALPDVAAGARRAVRRRAARRRRADRAGADALEPPALLRLLRDHRLGAGHPRRAADRGVQRERDGVVDLAGGDRARAGRRSTGSRSCSACRAAWHGHIEDTASTSTLAALAAARALQARRRRLRLRARALLGREGGADPRARVPHGAGRRRVPHAHRLPARRRDRGRGHRRHDLVDLGRPRAGARRPLRARRASGSTSTPRTRASAAVCPELRWCLDGCDRADSIVVNPHKWLFTPIDCSALWTRRPEALHAAFAAHGDYLASSEDAIDLRDYGPALGRRFRALKLWTVLRCYGRDGPAGADPRARPARGAVRGVGARRARLGDLGAAALLDRLLPPPDAPTTTSSRGARPRRARSSSRRRSCAGESVIRLAIGNARTQEADVVRALGGAARDARGDLRPLGHARRVAGRGGARC